MNAADPSPVLRTAPPALWRVAAAFLHMLHGLFGAPEDVAFRHALTSAAHGALAGWLRCAEALMRRLIVIEASAYPKPNTRPLLLARRKRARKLRAFSAELPEKWRVSFRCLSSPVYGGSVSARSAMTMGAAPSVAPNQVWADTSPARGGGNPFRSAWPLAERYEALIRVFNDPAPHAKRLAARLHATPHRLREALRAPPDARDRVDRFDELSESAKASWRRHLSSA